MKLLENTGSKKHVIKLIEGKHPPYGLIYSLRLIELEILNAYIKTHLRSGFIHFSKSLKSTPIFLIRSMMTAFAYKSIIKTLKIG